MKILTIRTGAPVAAKAFLVAAISLLTFSSCKPTTEGETAKWKTNMASLAQLETDMSQFSAPIGEVKKRAEAAWADAEKISDTDKKAEAMKAANDIITKGFAGQLMEIPKMQDEIQRIREKLSGKTMAQTIIDKIDSAVEDTDAADELYEKALSDGAETEAAANALVAPAYEAMSSCQRKWSSISSDYDKYKKKKK